MEVTHLLVTQQDDPDKRVHQGLTSDQVLESRQQHGANILTPPVRDPWWKLYLEKFDDPVIRILLIAVLLSFGVGLAQGGHYAESIGVFVAVMLATGLAFLNEYRASREFEILNRESDDNMISVKRNGVATPVPRKEIVVGDLVLLGNKDTSEIPADGHLVESVALLVNESALTGERIPVRKVTRDETSGVEGSTYPPYVVLRGTMVVDGHGKMIVDRVGDATEIGQTAREASAQIEDKSPLNQQLERLAKWIGVIGFGIAVSTFAALVVRGVILGELVLTFSQWCVAGALGLAGAILLIPVWAPIVYDFFELTGRKRKPPEWLEEGARAWGVSLVSGALSFVLATGLFVLLDVVSLAPSSWLPLEVIQHFLLFFMIAVTIVVVAVPEGLAMSVTLSLAYSMRRMVANKSLVRRLNATETIGAATHICSDKTGTLTLNRMRVQETLFPYVVHAGQNQGIILEAMAANSTANLGRTKEGEEIPIGDPTEGALLHWIREQGEDYELIRAAFRDQRQLPFSSERKMMATLGCSPEANEWRLHVKGAPEIVLEHCMHHRTPDGVLPLSEVARVEIRAGLLEAQRRGMRTLGFAYRLVDEHERTCTDLSNLVVGLIWLGFVSITDPVRPDVPDAIRRAHTSGIHVKIVTGDDLDTAKEVGRQIGLWQPEDEHMPGRAVLGPDFQGLNDEEALRIAPGLKILARARPADKLKLVHMLERQGSVVAVTGDGINDAPALNFAAVGIAMGSGHAVAKEASDIVILDDSFSSITTAVLWGRSLYLNIQKFILFQLTINVAACGIALLGPFIGIEFPLTVTQMLWVNLIMDTFAALALATEPPEADTMKRAPRKQADFIVTPEMARNIFITGGVFLALLVLLLKTNFLGGETERQQLTIFFTFFVLLQFWNQLNARTFGSSKSAFSGLRENPWFLAILGITLLGQVLITTFGGELFRTVPLSVSAWLLLLAVTSPVLWIGEVLRWRQRLQASAATPSLATV